MSLDFSEYDQRNYPIVEPREGYAVWSRFYDEKMTTHMDIDLLERVQEIDWASIADAADLACGTGRIGAWLRHKGVGALDGVDLTDEMLEHARALDIYRSLMLGDMRETALASAGYDLITNSLACEHIEDLTPLYAEAARLSRPGGWFALVAYHPVFMLRGIPTHFSDEDGNNTSIATTIHLTEDHVAAARETGWQLSELFERIIDDAWLRQMPNYERHKGWTVSLATIWRRAD